ncbi:Lrp/AsnC ligand binding domain-containing protein [Rhizobium johnstonii]|uniref:Lrp/AsnC ligand binding domain-containing protein n=1 Tax=Rhizobium TaxID=379 RepID=UPI000AF06683|nr:MULTISPECIES: Lrp/AsnC ligand binding domain-containing protein [Rhizobium]
MDNDRLRCPRRITDHSQIWPRVGTIARSAARPLTGVRAEVAPSVVGLGAMVMVGVVLDRSTPESFGAFEGAVMELKEVLDCSLVAGDFDYLLKIRVRDMADFNKLHGQKLIALPGVRQTRTFFVMKKVKENARLPF